MDEQATTGLVKLLKKSVPVKFNPSKYVLKEAHAELGKLQSTGPLSNKASLKGLASFFKKRSGPIETKIEALKTLITVLEKHEVDAVMVPLTESEHLECQAHLTFNLTSLRRAFEWQGISEVQKKEQEDSINMVAEAAMVSKWLECSLKKKDKVDGEWVRHWDRGGNKQVDPRVLRELFTIYQVELVLTDDEKKN